jgi:hypothetical protein
MRLLTNSQCHKDCFAFFPSGSSFLSNCVDPTHVCRMGVTTQASRSGKVAVDSDLRPREALGGQVHDLIASNGGEKKEERRKVPKSRCHALADLADSRGSRARRLHNAAKQARGKRNKSSCVVVVVVVVGGRGSTRDGVRGAVHRLNQETSLFFFSDVLRQHFGATY